MANLYRKSSLEKISNPEQLDRAITVSSPMSWLALAGVALIFAAVIIWGFLGTIPETVQTDGIVVSYENAKSIFSDQSNYNGEMRAVICYVPMTAASNFETGKAVKILPYSGSGQSFDVSIKDLKSLADLETGSVLESGPYWNSTYTAVLCELPAGTGLEPGTLIKANLISEKIKPIDKVFGGLNK